MVTVLYHYNTLTPWNATDPERGVREIKAFGYNGVVMRPEFPDTHDGTAVLWMNNALNSQTFTHARMVEQNTVFSSG